MICRADGKTFVTMIQTSHNNVILCRNLGVITSSLNLGIKHVFDMLILWLCNFFFFTYMHFPYYIQFQPSTNISPRALGPLANIGSRVDTVFNMEKDLYDYLHVDEGR